MQDRHLGKFHLPGQHVDVKQTLGDKAENPSVVVRIRRYVEPALKFREDVEEPRAVVVEQRALHDHHIEAVSAR